KTPNAVALAASDVDRIVSRVLPTRSDGSEVGLAKGGARRPISQASVEIGSEVVSQQVIDQTSIALEQAPPVKFDIARQVRVFEPYLQYVELKLTGAAIERRKVRIPDTIQNLVTAEDLEGRLRTTFDLVEKNDQLSSKQLESELKAIRDAFTPCPG